MKKLKKETKDKIFSVLKFVGTLLVEALWTLLVFAFGFCVGADKFAGLRSSSVMKASAEGASISSEVSTVSEEVESGFDIDLSNYPMANLVPYPYNGTINANGITWTENPDGTVVANGTATARSVFYIISSASVFKFEEGTYRISGTPIGYTDVASGVLMQVDYRGPEGVIDCLNINSSGCVVDVASDMYINVWRLVIHDGVTVENVVFSPMITKGETVYPYMPSFDLLYANMYDKIYDSAYGKGYDSGLTDGEEKGYSSGFNDGYSDGLDFSFGRQGLINPITVDSVVAWGLAADGSGSLKTDISSYFLSYDNYTQDTTTGLSLLDTSLGECYPEYKSFSSVVISFKKTFNLRDLNLLLRSGSDDCPTYIGSLYFSVGFPNSGTEVLTVKTNVTDYVDFYEGGFYSINSSLSKTDFYFDHVQIMINHWGQPNNDVLMPCLAGSPLLNFYVSNDVLVEEALKAEYDKGYDAGFHIGHESGYEQGYWVGNADGKEIGYDEGYNVGKEGGFVEGKEFGYTGGYQIGYDKGFELGKNKGYIDGENAGYTKGFNDAGDSGGFGWLISSVQTFLETDFFGSFSIGDLVYVMIGVSFVLLFLKFFSK